MCVCVCFGDNRSSVTVLTEKNFDDIALSPEKDVLVEFYAPWYVYFVLIIFFVIVVICEKSRIVQG